MGQGRNPGQIYIHHQCVHVVFASEASGFMGYAPRFFIHLRRRQVLCYCFRVILPRRLPPIPLTILLFPTPILRAVLISPLYAPPRRSLPPQPGKTQYLACAGARTPRYGIGLPRHNCWQGQPSGDDKGATQNHKYIHHLGQKAIPSGACFKAPGGV